MSHPPPGEEHWARVESRFLEALEQPVSMRGAFLDAACGGDTILRQEVDALLEGHASGGVLPELAETAPDPDTLPDRIANYRILRRLGEGGMGVVLLAIREGEGFEQTVALKLIRGNIADQLLTRRLEEERRILAGLEHPSIARLIDGGVTAEGQPYYAMEYIEGTDLLAWCRTRQSGMEERLRVFIDVCDAVHYAHQQLIVHRDLKPSNIFVTTAGRAKLLDFGIATSLAHGVAQEVSQHWVTPAYASPEQVNGRPVSTLSDVYALGVLLCELLTGTRPYDTTSGSPAEISRIVSEEPPRRPSELLSQALKGDAGASSEDSTADRSTRQRIAKALRPDLDLIALKALAKDPARRYDSVRALADDVRSYLAGRPIQARPDSAGYRTRMFLRRHRLKVTAAGLVALAIIVGGSAAAWQARRATVQRNRAELESARARQVAGLLTEIFRLGDPAQSLGDTIGVRRVLEEGVARVRRELREDGELQATLLLELARIHRNLGILDQAEVLGAEALRLRETLAPGTLAHSEALGLQGVLLRAVARPDEAVRMLQQGIDLRSSLLDAPDTTLAEWMTELAWEVRLAGDLPRAATLFSGALEIERQLRGPNHPIVATNLVGLAATYHDQGSFDEGERLFRSALDLGVANRPTPLAATVLLNLGMVRRLREQFVEAEQLLRSAVGMRQALYDPTHPGVLEASEQLGLALIGLGRLAEADSVLRQSLLVAGATLGEEHHLTRGGREGLAGVDWELGRFRTASARFDSVLAAKQRANGLDHSGNVFTLLTMGDVAVDVGHLELASRYFAEAQAMRGRLGESGGAYELLIAHGRARMALGRGDLHATDSLLTYAIAEGELRPNHRYVLEVQRTRARWLLAVGRAGDAEALLRGVLRAEEAARPRPHPRRGETLTLLGMSRLALGDRTGARALFERARGELIALPATHPKVRAVQAGLAAALTP